MSLLLLHIRLPICHSVSDLDSFSLACVSGIILCIATHPISTCLVAHLPVCVCAILSTPNYALYLTLPVGSGYALYVTLPVGPGSFSTSKTILNRTTRLNTSLKASNQSSLWHLPPRESQVTSRGEDGCLLNMRQTPD